MLTIFTDRSRVETFQACPRKRWLEYHEGFDGLGIVPAKKPLALCVGGSVHRGLEVLLREGGAMWEHGDPAIRQPWGELAKHWTLEIEEHAVAAALADFATHCSALALDTTELAALSAVIDPKDAGFPAQLEATARELGMDPNDSALVELLGRQHNAAAEFDDWLYREQAALVEGLVRAYARRRLRPLLEEFEVLEVEREERWTLAEWEGRETRHDPNAKLGHIYSALEFLSRPDALLRSRADNSLYLLSFKTAAQWDIRKERDAQHDMQGLSEGVGVEKRLGEWWHKVQEFPADSVYLEINVENAAGDLVRPDDVPSTAMVRYLRSLAAPPRILGIRMEYLLKGSRYADKDLAARFGLNVWAQRSHLVRAYHNGDWPDKSGSWCWSYDFKKDDGSASKLYYKKWRPRAVWEEISMREWIDMLDSTEMAMSAYDSTVGQEPREIGYRSAAQAEGFTVTHPLDDLFPASLLVYRQDDDLRDWVEQTEAQERRVAEGVAQVEAVGEKVESMAIADEPCPDCGSGQHRSCNGRGEDEGEKRHLLNVLFPMSRKACSYPTECAYTKVCYGGDDIRRDPLGSGLYHVRTPNHPAESES